MDLLFVLSPGTVGAPETRAHVAGRGAARAASGRVRATQSDVPVYSGEDEAVEEFKQSSKQASTPVYTAVPTDRDGKPLLRVLVIGSEAEDRVLAQKLAASDRVTGVYYVGDREGVCDIEMSKIATTVPVLVSNTEAWVGFCSWARVNVVFIGAGRTIDGLEEVEKELAAQDVTLYGADIAQGVIDETLALERCLKAPVDLLREELPKLRKRAQEMWEDSEADGKGGTGSD